MIDLIGVCFTYANDDVVRTHLEWLSNIRFVPISIQEFDELCNHASYKEQDTLDYFNCLEEFEVRRL